MPIHICFSALFLASAIFIYVSPQNAIQEYVIRKDLLSGVKAGEFSISDISGNPIRYRIESDYGIFQKLRLIAYPSKQVVGRLQARFNLFLYKAEISVLNSQTNQWINGSIEQDLKLLGSMFTIQWNGRQITMETEPISLTSNFFDTNKEVLAQCRIRPASIIWAKKYDLKIFSTKYPEQMYLLAFAARIHIASRSNRG